MNQLKEGAVYEYDEETEMYSVELKRVKDKGKLIEFVVFRPASIITLPDELVKSEKPISKRKTKISGGKHGRRTRS
ncbi:MAG: hypothetical protein ABH950_00135 [Candidatus Altiarchaeota archaeon]